MTTLSLPIAPQAIDLEAWEPGYLGGTFEIAGVPFHVEAVETEDETGLTATNPACQGRIDAAITYDDPTPKGYQTVQIDGKPHFLILIPFQR